MPARLEFPVTVITSKGPHLEPEAHRVDFITMFLNRGADRILFSILNGGNGGLGGLNLFNLPAKVKEMILASEEFSMPAFRDEMESFLQGIGFDLDDRSLESIRHLVDHLSPAVLMLERLKHAHLREIAVYEGFLKARKASEDEIRASGQVFFCPFTEDYQNFRGELFSYIAKAVSWGGLRPIDLSDLSPSSIEDSLNEELSDFVEGGSIELLDDFHGLRDFLVAWHRKNGLDPNWGVLDEAMNPPLDESLLEDRELVTFIKEWNSRQNVTAYMVDRSRFALGRGVTTKQAAAILRGRIERARNDRDACLTGFDYEPLNEPTEAPLCVGL